MDALKSTLVVLLLLLLILFCVDNAYSCRVGSEKLKSYTRKSIERLLDVEQLESVYWPDESLDAGLLARATGINITLAETHFRLDGGLNAKNQNEIHGGNNTNHKEPLLRDLFVTCSVDRDRSYALSINLELSNPFKMIDVNFDLPEMQQEVTKTGFNKKSGLFRIRLPQSTFLVHLKQRIRYDECLVVNFIQIAPNVNYEIECVGCSDEQQNHLDRIFSKRMTQLDAELDSTLSEKLLLGLQVLFNQQRLELDLYLN